MAAAYPPKGCQRRGRRGKGTRGAVEGTASCSGRTQKPDVAACPLPEHHQLSLRQPHLGHRGLFLTGVRGAVRGAPGGECREDREDKEGGRKGRGRAEGEGGRMGG